MHETLSNTPDPGRSPDILSASDGLPTEAGPSYPPYYTRGRPKGKYIGREELRVKNLSSFSTFQGVSRTLHVHSKIIDS